MNPSERPDRLFGTGKQGAIAMNENRKTELNTEPQASRPDRRANTPETKKRVLRATNAAADRERERSEERRRLRADRKKAKSAQAERAGKEEPARADGEAKPKRWVRIRLIPIWLRILIVLLAIAAAVALGLMFGYGVLGEGKAVDALKPDTWKHILDIIRGEE